MQSSEQSTLILRHRKERLSKCSLKGLEGCAELRFFSYPNALPVLFEGMKRSQSITLLSPRGEPLSALDAARPLLLLDATWRLADKMEKAVSSSASQAHITLLARALPTTLRTAYRRRQTDCPVSMSGLSSAEALFSAQLILHRPSIALNHYRWKEEFLRVNFHILQPLIASFAQSDLSLRHLLE